MTRALALLVLATMVAGCSVPSSSSGNNTTAQTDYRTGSQAGEDNSLRVGQNFEFTDTDAKLAIRLHVQKGAMVDVSVDYVMSCRTGRHIQSVSFGPYAVDSDGELIERGKPAPGITFAGRVAGVGLVGNILITRDGCSRIDRDWSAHQAGIELQIEEID